MEVLEEPTENGIDEDDDVAMMEAKLSRTISISEYSISITVVTVFVYLNMKFSIDRAVWLGLVRFFITRCRTDPGRQYNQWE